MKLFAKNAEFVKLMLIVRCSVLGGFWSAEACFLMTTIEICSQLLGAMPGEVKHVCFLVVESFHRMLNYGQKCI